MGRYVLVVGTNAIPAYQIEAQQRMQSWLYATRDTDLAWRGASAGDEAVLWPAIREFYPKFTINAERPFQAIGHASRELERLAAPSVVDTLKFEPFMPAENLVEQEWLLMGQPLRQVIGSLTRTPCGFEVPDPRFFALHKAWLPKKPGRDPRRAPKDLNQAKRVWSWLPDMPGHPIDDAFRSTLPDELKPVLDELERGGDSSS